MHTEPTEPGQTPAPQEQTDSRPTVPLKPAVDGFEPLPEGALVGEEAYYITSLRSEGPGQNVYGVEEIRPVFPCPNPECGYMSNPSGEKGCKECSTPLTDVMPVHRRYQLHEYRDSAEIATAARATEFGLSHSGLLIYRYFKERPYSNRDRFYLVAPDPMPLLASNLGTPQKVARVLNWGAQLADALHYLHEHDICWQNVTADHIAIRERRAMWIDFTAAQSLSSNKAEARQQQTSDVVNLTRLLFKLATGEDTYTPQPNLPEAAHVAFEGVLGSEPQITTAEALAQTFKEAAATVRRPATVRLRVGRHTDVGMIRDLNEDSLLALGLDRVHRSINYPIGLYVVADGMGGHDAGDVASGLAINVIAEKMASSLLVPLTSEPSSESFDAQRWLEDAIQAANQAVFMHRQSAGTNMGTTLVVALAVGDMIYIANVGDSRAYLINDEACRQITTDHSLVERLISMGQITPQEARTHPQKNVIYRTIGAEEEVAADFFTHQLKPGDSLLLCSDGLSNLVEDDTIWQIVKESCSPQEACEELVQAANNNGGDDNITVTIVQAGNAVEEPTG